MAEIQNRNRFKIWGDKGRDYWDKNAMNVMQKKRKRGEGGETFAKILK